MVHGEEVPILQVKENRWGVGTVRPCDTFNSKRAPRKSELVEFVVMLTAKRAIDMV